MKKALIAAGLVVLLAAVGTGVFLARQDPTGMAVGDGGAQRALWDAMAPHGEQFLNAYGDQLAAPPDDPMLALSAFNELAYSITGRGGLWRKMLPTQYFGCGANQADPICGAFREAEPAMAGWDKLQARIADLPDERAARAFLRQNGAVLQEYIRTFVPRDRSLTAVRATPFFRDRFGRYLPQ